MFSFAVKKTPAQAQESLVEKDPEIRNYKSLCLSENGRQMIITGCVRGIVSALAKLLRMRGDKPEGVVEKIKPFIVSCVSSGDLGKKDAEWILSDDWFFSQTDYLPCYCRPSDSLYSFFHEILEDAKGSRLWSACDREYYGGKISAEEKAILDAYEKAREAYYDAMKIRDQYFAKKGALVVHDVLRKYASQISAIDQEFYNFMSRQIAETLSQMDGDNACPSDPSIKNELATNNAPLIDLSDTVGVADSDES